MIISDVPDRLAEQLPPVVLEEIGSQRQIRREIYHHLRRKHQGFFVSAEAANLVSGVATALLGLARTLERSGVPMPREFQVRLSQLGDNDESGAGFIPAPYGG